MFVHVLIRFVLETRQSSSGAPRAKLKLAGNTWHADVTCVVSHQFGLGGLYQIKKPSSWTYFIPPISF
jgi:hypothetical protein